MIIVWFSSQFALAVSVILETKTNVCLCKLQGKAPQRNLNLNFAKGEKLTLFIVGEGMYMHLFIYYCSLWLKIYWAYCKVFSMLTSFAGKVHLSGYKISDVKKTELPIQSRFGLVKISWCGICFYLFSFSFKNVKDYRRPSKIYGWDTPKNQHLPWRQSR